MKQLSLYSYYSSKNLAISFKGLIEYLCNVSECGQQFRSFEIWLKFP